MYVSSSPCNVSSNPLIHHKLCYSDPNGTNTTDEQKMDDSTEPENGEKEEKKKDEGERQNTEGGEENQGEDYLRSVGETIAALLDPLGKFYNLS